MAMFPFWSKPLCVVAQGVDASVGGPGTQPAQETLRRIGPFLEQIYNPDRAHPHDYYRAITALAFDLPAANPAAQC